MRDGLGASTFEMSLVVLCLATGSLLGLLVSGRAIERFGTKHIMKLTVVAQALALPLAATLMLLPGALVPGLMVLFVFGLCFSAVDIAMNVSGAAAERALGNPRMPLMHAFFSIGVGLAMLLGAAAEALSIAVQLHLLVAAAAGGVAGLSVMRLIPGDARDRAAGGADAPVGSAAMAVGSEDQPTPKSYSPWRDPRVLILGLITFTAGLSEGASSDWLPLAFVDGRGVSNEFGTTMLGVFFVGMIVSRLSGSALLTRFSRTAVLRGGLTLATIGILLVALAPGQTAAVIGTIAWGLGTGICWPITISAAADRTESAVRDVAAVSAIAYTAMLLGPMVFGMLGEHFGLLTSFLVLPVFTVIAFVFADVARPPNQALSSSGQP